MIKFTLPKEIFEKVMRIKVNSLEIIYNNIVFTTDEGKDYIHYTKFLKFYDAWVSRLDLEELQKLAKIVSEYKLSQR